MECYGELKKAFPDVLKAIKEVTGKDDCIEADGNNRNRRYRYVGEMEDPLGILMNAEVIKDLEEYAEFCVDSSGFMPESWLQHFMGRTWDFLEASDRKRKGEQIMGTDMEGDGSKNVDMVPRLYEHIKKKEVLQVVYKPYDKDEMHLVFHPHYLREFNRRWFLLGQAEGHVGGMQTKDGFVVALDRIVAEPTVLADRVWEKAEAGFYQRYFENIVGVTHWKMATPQNVVLRAHSLYMYGLVETCPLHHSQKVRLEYGKHEDGEYGEFELYVEMNNELIGRILQKGAGLEVVSPANVRENIGQCVREIYDRYKSHAYEMIEE